MRYLALLLLLAGCATEPAWQQYDAGVAMLWVSTSLDAVDAKCRERGADPEGRRSDRLRGCADFCANEIFSIPDPGVIAHESWHAATRSVVEPKDTCPINLPGEGPR